MASSSGVECFWTVASDSPTRVLNFVASWLRTFSTSSFRAAVELLLVEEISGSAVLGAETEHVLAAEARNRSRDDRGASSPDAEVARNIVGQSRAGGLPHQLERLADAFLRHDAQKRRLLELHREPLAQRFVEHRVAGRVREIGEDDGVLVGQLRRTMQVHVAADNRRDESRACRCQQQGSPQRPSRRRSRRQRRSESTRCRASPVADRRGSRTRADSGDGDPSRWLSE